MQLDRRDKSARKGRALEALTKSALALPGLAGLAGPAQADAPTPDWEVDLSGSWYKEADLSEGQWAEELGGSTERYSIQAYQLGVLAPITNQIDASVDLVFETMSGATPWYVLPDAGDPEGRPVAAMTGATIEDTRIDGQFTVNHYFDRGRLSMSGGFSTENDYGSGNFGLSAERNYNDKNTTLSGSMSFSWDTVRPTDAVIHGHEAGAEYDKKTRTVSVSLSQLLTRSSVMQLGYTYKNNVGFLSDPYKDVYFTLTTSRENDSRPDVRNQHTLLLRYRQFLSAPNASLHLDLQGYFDSWDVRSLGVTTAWYQSLGGPWELVPSFRYYSQSQALFYAPYFDAPNQDYFSSDYRLSPFGALQAGIRVAAQLDNLTKWAVWNVSAGYDYYWSSEKFALGNVAVGNPGLVRWGLLSARISGRF
ncbi:MAG: DUF3570 domain-containing protein [Actinomycetota bacterium]|nr:DUF3570 domain-containing protein [Actinomycetota bacterium]